jgi:tetratricopeptide (TPR) repeat protein
MTGVGRIRLREVPLAAALVLASVTAGLTPIADGDVFWHLGAGRVMASTGHVLRHDPFSISAAGRPWVDVHWLFQLGVYALEQAFGLGGLVIAKCALVSGGALLLYTAIDRSARPLFVVWLSAALLCARHLLLVRPVIVSLLFLALFFVLLERHRRRDAAGALLLLPLAQCVWSNCQGLSAFGPALVLAYAAPALATESGWLARPSAAGPDRQRARRRACALLGTAAACVAASLATPFGWRGLALSPRLLARLLPGADNPYLEVAENVPPFVLERLEPGTFWHVKWYLAALALAFLLSRRRVVTSHLLLLAGVVGLGLISNRNVLLLYWLATPIAALQLTPQLRRLRARLARSRAGRLGPWLLPVLAPLLLVVVIGVGLAAARAEPSLHAPTPFRFPVHSAALLQQVPNNGSIFSADHQGGYLIWSLFPRFVPYMDTRLVLRTPQEYAEYLGLLQNPDRFAAFQRRHRFSYAILPVGYPDRYLPLIATLYRDPEWTLIFTDGSETLFARRELTPDAGWDLHASATTDRVLRAIARAYGRTPRLHEAARISAASLEIAVGSIEQAERILGTMESQPARALRARTRLAAGDLEGARRLAEQSLRESSDDLRSLTLMAAVCLRLGQYRDATRYLRRAVAIDPFDAEATHLREAMEQQDDRY